MISASDEQYASVSERQARMSESTSEFVRYVKRPIKPLASRLGRLDIELTERCNSRCIHCYINQPEHDPVAKAREMSTAFVQSILRQAADLGALTVRFTGGEPLLRDDFTELYLFARRLGLKVLIFTNARLVTEELAQLFARIPPGEPIEVTVYGMHAASYDAVSGTRGAFAEFKRGLDLLQTHGVPVVVKLSLLPQNRHEVAEFEAFAATLPRMDRPPGYAMNFDLRARRDDPAKNRAIRRLRHSPAETIAMLTRDPERYTRSMQEFASKFMGPPGDRLFSCGAGCGVSVDASGQAQMCLQLRHPETLCPLSDSAEPGLSLSDQGDPSPLAVALTEVFPRYRERPAANPDYLRRCARCFLKGLCEQCPAKSWQEHGTLDTPVEYLCEVAHTQARWLGWLGSDEAAWTVRDWQARIDKGPLSSKKNKG